MKKLTVSFLLFFIFFTHKSLCLTRIFLAHPQGAGMGGATVALEGMWAGFCNPAGLAPSLTSSIGFGFRQTLCLKETGEAFGVLNISSSLGNWGGVVNYHGMDSYQELFFGLNYSRQIGKSWWGGFQFDYLRVHFPEEQGEGVFTFSAGVLIEVLPKCLLGAYVFNPQGSTLHFLYYEEEIPRLMGTGLQVGAGKNFRFMGDWQKAYSQKGTIHLGCEWKVHPQLVFRMGGQSYPEQLSIGVTFSLGGFSAETGFQRISNFGNATTGALGWHPKSPR